MSDTRLICQLLCISQHEMNVQFNMSSKIASQWKHDHPQICIYLCSYRPCLLPWRWPCDLGIWRWRRYVEDVQWLNFLGSGQHLLETLQSNSTLFRFRFICIVVARGLKITENEQKTIHNKQSKKQWTKLKYNATDTMQSYSRIVYSAVHWVCRRDRTLQRLVYKMVPGLYYSK